MQNLLLGGSTVALVAASAFFTVPAFAQNANSTDIETVVVTGTSIRGVAPVGSNLITVGQEEITKTGAQNVQQLLANVPAVSGMGNGGEGGAIHNNYYQPTIHQLGASASNATLILLDGHRPPTGGTNHSTADPNIVPNNMIERVEVIANGASATYGSDAVAGVINFITRKRFDGVQLSAEAQIIDGSSNQNFGVLAGNSWEHGSAIFAYQFYNQQKLMSRNRPYTYPNQTARAQATGIPITSNSSNTNFLSFTCTTPRVRINGAGNYYDLVTGQSINSASQNADCTEWANNSTLENASQRHNAMIKITEDIRDNFTIGADLVYSTRREHSIGGRGSVSNVTVFGAGPQANPFYTNPTGVAGTNRASISTSTTFWAATRRRVCKVRMTVWWMSRPSIALGTISSSTP
jgi:iron complex outermembrane receptor protein